MDQTTEICTDFSFFNFILSFQKYDLLPKTAFLDIFLIFLLSTKKIENYNNGITSLSCFIFPSFGKNEKMKK